jgi:DNA-binding response OmpR family regulator
VIMLSSRDGVFDRSRGKLVGAHNHLAKPFSREALLQAVQPAWRAACRMRARPWRHDACRPKHPGMKQ